jgi:putative MFS permease
MGIALCTAIFTAYGAYAPGERFTAGLVPALGACTLLLAAATVLVAAMPRDEVDDGR